MSKRQLTDQDRAKFPEYKEKWLKVGLCTDPADRDKAEYWARKAYEEVNLTPPDKVVWVDSPKAAVNYCKQEGIPDTSAMLYGNHEASWMGFYEFFLKEWGIDKCKRLIPLMELSKVCGWWSPYDKLMLMQERPLHIHRNTENRLHKDMGMAVEYRDGWGIYRLNGIRVPKDIVMTPADKLDVQLVLKTENVDVRREIVEKIGMVRILEELNAVPLDVQGEYILYNLDIGDGEMRPYLKMQNPSIDAIHVEGVPPGTTTVVQALTWRNGLDEWIEPEILT